MGRAAACEYNQRRQHIPRPESTELMSDGTRDEAKGRLKEAGGDLTDDQDMKNEGKVDRATGTVKDKAEDAPDKAKEVVGKD